MTALSAVLEQTILTYILSIDLISIPQSSVHKSSYLDDAAGALNVKLTAEDIAYLEEMYVPHPIVGAIDHNPAQDVMLLDEKK